MGGATMADKTCQAGTRVGGGHAVFPSLGLSAVTQAWSVCRSRALYGVYR